MPGHFDFESLVNLHYAALYRFALSLTRKEEDACDLTQHAFLALATKGHQLQDGSKAKSWLFTTLYREFLHGQRSDARFPHQDLDDTLPELPVVEPETVRRMDATDVTALLARVDNQYQAPVALFYLEDYSYQEISEVLGIPLGTVKSRISRGLTQLQQMLCYEPLAVFAVKKGTP